VNTTSNIPSNGLVLRIRVALISRWKSVVRRESASPGGHCSGPHCILLLSLVCPSRSLHTAKREPVLGRERYRDTDIHTYRHTDILPSCKGPHCILLLSLVCPLRSLHTAKRGVVLCLPGLSASIPLFVRILCAHMRHETCANATSGRTTLTVLCVPLCSSRFLCPHSVLLSPAHAANLLLSFPLRA
jgi:hypothetical protein